MMKENRILVSLDGSPIRVEFFRNPGKRYDHVRKHGLLDPLPVPSSSSLRPQRLATRESIRQLLDEKGLAPPALCLSKGDSSKDLCSQCRLLEEECRPSRLKKWRNDYARAVHDAMCASAPDSPASPLGCHWHLKSGSDEEIHFVSKDGLYIIFQRLPSQGEYNMKTAHYDCGSPDAPGEADPGAMYAIAYGYPGMEGDSGRGRRRYQRMHDKLAKKYPGACRHCIGH